MDKQKAEILLHQGDILCVMLQLCAVYLFEYVAQGCAAKVRPKIEYNIGCPELYAGLSLCYQVTIHTLLILPGDNPYSPYAIR